MEGLAAVVGFWAFCILLVMRFTRGRKDSTPAIESYQCQVQALSVRVESLEAQLSGVSHTLLELKDGHDFMHKLLTDKEKSPLPLKK